MADPVCSAVSLTLGEPLMATASMVRNWVLIEHPGAWGPVALQESGLPAPISAGLAGLAREHNVRVLLIRRPVRPSDGSRQCFVAHSGRRARWIRQGAVGDIEQLLEVDFGPLQEGGPVAFGTARATPLYLVCTNGRHDPCCANLGRPVARALHARSDGADGSAWECSHFGGDRFAGNLVCLPHGLYFGRLTPDHAVSVAEGYERGELDLEHYRGRAGEPFAVQAAEHFLRAEEGLLGINDVRPITHRSLDGGLVEVDFDGSGGRAFRVRVAVRPAADPRPLSCGADGEARPPTYALVDLRER